MLLSHGLKKLPRLASGWISAAFLLGVVSGTRVAADDSGSKATGPDYLAEVTSEADFVSIALPSGTRPEIEFVSKFTTPAAADPLLLHTVYQNVRRYTLHQEFLIQVFPDYFSSLDDYAAMFLRRATRDYYVGGLFRIRTENGSRVYGFDVAIDESNPSELLTAEETRSIYERLLPTFHLTPFLYVPSLPGAVARALSWEDPGFPLYFFPGDVPQPPYVPYTVAANYGRVRLMTIEQLAEESQNGRISWQDILVLDKTPFDVEGVVAGVITGERQAELSHVAVRSARRGTPNAYVQNAHETFAPYSDQLVRLEVGDAAFTVETGVDPSDAAAFWEEIRPVLSVVSEADLEYATLDNVLEMDLSEAEGPLSARFGGKAANLARMYSVLPPDNQVPAFAIPFKYYDEFMATNQILDERVEPPVVRTFKEYIESLLEDPQFQTDGEYRAALLESFRDTMESNGFINPLLVDALGDRIERVFGSRLTMVRFRSSSNVEDNLVFNGAGLYDSTSVCAEDTFDTDTEGPSHCDASQTEERTIDRGLKKVWASLWNFRAYEEREYYQVPQSNAVMAILVNPAVPDEASNGVAFTGDPIAGATAGYVVNAQVGENSVVHPDVDVLPEKDVLQVEAGSVASIKRLRGSSLLPPGEWVLSDEQLGRLGSAMAILEANMPLDLEGYSPDDVLLDVEFKFTQEDKLVFKQVRPFLRTGATPPKVFSKYDLDKNGILNGGDLFLFSKQWGE